MEEEQSRRRTLAGHEDAGGGVGRSLGPLRDLEVAHVQPPRRRRLLPHATGRSIASDDNAMQQRARNRDEMEKLCCVVLCYAWFGLVLRGDRWALGGKKCRTGKKTIDVERLRDL